MTFQTKYIFLFFSLFLSLLINSHLGKVLSINEDVTLKFEKISVESGLSQGTVNAVLQDNKGFLWFGTEDGLNKYDGYSFVVFKNSSLDSNSISHNNVSALFEDSLGTIWVGTRGGGLNKYYKKHNSFKRYEFDENDPLCYGCTNVNVIYEDSKGVIWIGSASAGLHKYDSENDGFIKLKSDSANNNLPTNNITSIYEDSYGKFWIGTILGLYSLDRETGIFTEELRHKELPNVVPYNKVNEIFEDQYGILWASFGVKGLNRFDRKRNEFVSYLIDNEDPSSFTYNDVITIDEDNYGNLWIGTDGGGLYTFDREREIFVGYQNSPGNPNTLSSNYVRSVYEDRSGIIWIGTWGGGVNKAVREKQHFDTFQRNPDVINTLSHNRVLSLLTSKNGTVWIGTDGGGLNEFDIESEIFKHHKFSGKKRNTISSNYVSALYEDDKKQLWIGTLGGGLNKLNQWTGEIINYPFGNETKDNLNSPIVTSIEQDKNGNLWIGTYGGGINIIPVKQINSRRPIYERMYADSTNPLALTSNIISMLYKDTDGIMWIATEGGGLLSYDIDTKEFSPYVSNPNDSTTISSNKISTIYGPENDKDILWIGTFDNGLCKLTKGYKDEPAQFDVYNISHGLPSNTILSIIEDDDENLWIGTNKGLSKFNLADETFYNFDVRDGLQNNEFSINAASKANDGELLFGGVDGFNIFYPTKIKPIDEVPAVVLTDFKLFNISVLPGKNSPLEYSISESDKIVLDYDQDVFSIEFASLDLNDPRRNEYAYTLEGFNEDWITTSWDNRIATYTSLAAGTYIFKVVASNSDGLWNDEGASVIVEVNPPFWETWWFLSLAILIVGSIVFFSFKRRFHNVRMKIELQAAHDAQMSIMPQKDPMLDGYEVSGVCLPANEVGGDFFDYIWLNEEKTKFGIVVGDVSGKAMKSAMTAVLTSGMISARVEDTISIDEIMTKINHPIFQKTERKMFIALCFASLDLSNNELNFTNAGLLQPLLKSNGSIEMLESNGLKFPLGAWPDTKYEKRQITLKKDDVVLIYSDGLSDAQNSSKEFYGNDRIVEVLNRMNISNLSASQIKQNIVNDINSFIGTAPQHDDMTMVVVKVLNENKQANTNE
jgi:ligand-binding sensor domain-containing protein